MIPSFKLRQTEEILSQVLAQKVSSEVLKSNLLLIDVRSPSEFTEDHLPFAVNFPVLSDIERAEVGTEYKRNRFSARQLGARLISANLVNILEKLEDLVRKTSSGNHQAHFEFCLYCWRGGMRSRSLFTVMDMIGYKTRLLEGGYQAYRRFISKELELGFTPSTITLYGPSGTGKSELIRILRGYSLSILDLEGRARHKGSVWGENSEPQPSQKLFESHLYWDLKLANTDLLVVEGESRRIGKLFLPRKLYEHMCEGRHIWVELPVELRAERIAVEYKIPDEVLIQKLSSIKKFISAAIYKDIVAAILSKDRYKVALLLLQNYYDFFYRRAAPGGPKSPRAYEAVFRAKSFDQLQALVIDYFSALIH